MTTKLLASIGIDIGKEVFHVVGFGTDGKIAFRRKIKRLGLLEAFKLLPPSIVGMEACLSAHFVSRALRQLLRVVREKTQDQLDLQALHRVRSRLVSRRTATEAPHITATLIIRRATGSVQPGLSLST